MDLCKIKEATAVSSLSLSRFCDIYPALDTKAIQQHLGHSQSSKAVNKLQHPSLNVRFVFVCLFVCVYAE